MDYLATGQFWSAPSYQSCTEGPSAGRVTSGWVGLRHKVLRLGWVGFVGSGPVSIHFRYFLSTLQSAYAGSNFKLIVDNERVR